MSGRDGPRLWGSGRWSVGDQKNRLQPAHGCSIGLFGEGKSEIPDHASQRTYLEVSQALVKAAHGDQDPPLVVDPFAGGGSIPLEALRVGCEAFASDLNPVACLILKVMLEDIPRYGPKLAGEVRRVGAEINRQAKEELADLYPGDPD